MKYLGDCEGGKRGQFEDKANEEYVEGIAERLLS